MAIIFKSKDKTTVFSKFNPYHDRRGRFATGGGFMASGFDGDRDRQAVTFSANPNTTAGANSIARENQNHNAIGAAYGMKNEVTQNPRTDEKAQPKAEQKKPNLLGDPETIGGVKRGEPMTREQAGEGNANPNFSKGGGYEANPTSSAVAYEARLRGYDVTAKPRGEAEREIFIDFNFAWINPKTGKSPEYIRDKENVTTPKKCEEWLENTIKPGERYIMKYSIKGRGHYADFVSLDRDSNGQLRFTEAQTGKTIIGAKILNHTKYATSIYGNRISTAPRILRVDNMRINPKYSDEIMEAK